jgi:type II secretory pathway pseudopilin PulG
MRTVSGLTLVELLVATLLAGLLAAGATRLLAASTDQQQALAQGARLQAELRRAGAALEQALRERPFLLPLRGHGAGLEYLQALPESRFQVLGVNASGLTVRFSNPAYDPGTLRRALVVDSGGNGYVYSLSGVRALDPASGTYALTGTACAVPSGSGLQGVGARRARLGSGAALAGFAGGGSWPAEALYFQEEDRPPEALLKGSAPRLRYAYRAADGQTLHTDTPSLYQVRGGQRYALAGLALDFSAREGQGPREARRALLRDLSLQAGGGLGLRALECNPLLPPPPIPAGDWRVEVVGLDPGVLAAVEVAGPAGYRRSLSASATLTNLTQGRYELWAGSVVHPNLPFVRYRPASPAEGSRLGVDVGGANRPLTRVSYTRPPGTLRVQVAGLPAGLSAPTRADGTFERYAFSLGSGDHRLAVEAGRYTLDWPPQPSPDGRGEWLPDRSSHTVEVPGEGEGDAGVVTYRFRAHAARLELSVRDLSGRPVPPRVCVYPSDPSQPLVSPSANVQSCP